jgi:uncharacterized protein
VVSNQKLEDRRSLDHYDSTAYVMTDIGPSIADMATDYIRYDILAQTALRGVVRTVLADAAKKGLPGEHHFKITFNTTAPGVRLSPAMRTRYPQEMTIVLQHQFWDLAVTEQAFEVGLSFGGVPERVGVPFDAVTAFYDPAVQFGFQFETIEPVETGETGAKTAEKSAGAPTRKAESLPAAAPAAAPAVAPAAAADSDGGGGEVVRLDRFRKK